MRWQKLSIVLVLCVLPEPAPAWKADVVKAWARSLGDELWRLNEALTKSDQIRIRYKQMNASVKKKDGKQILESALRSVSTMLTRKINAVKCIHSTAERLAAEFNYVKYQENDTFEYCSAKYSDFTTETGEPPQFLEKRKKPLFAEENPHYMGISLEKDSHFYDINVNTNISCVHVPTNIYYLEYDAINAIMWSKDLNEVFIKNYQSDPSLSWQYFGSSHGILRFYPAMPWPTETVDTYDARVKSWYIEAATCSKDVIILFDVSGSMTGFKNYVARRTLKSLLETLSNNDHVNVYMFSKNTTKVVACFKDLVQATPENIQTIIDALEPTDGGKKPRVPLEGYANLTTAYRTAFETLKMKRKDCNVSSTQGCNQLVMLITDYVPGNLTEVFDEYNRETVNNKTYIPVRVFTYLIGKEVTNVNEIEWMACSNRGIFVHIHSVEEVQQQVLKYINVIARPMILEGKPPLTTWTHANMDYTRTKNWAVSGDIDKPDEDKLVTSVAIPAFDFKYNRENNDAMLLGVAGTDVPIDSIAKLAQPHQLGVNGYSFIVSNNGYLLLHPLLITSINGDLQKNYNSVDFVEVEQVDDGKGPRELGEKILMLREKLVNGDDGDMINVEVLFHYDNMRRIARVKHNYFFQQLEGTPFSMGISLPRGYGDTELLLKDNPLEAKQGQDIVGVNVTDYFRTSFRVHPDWVYCKYHYLEGHESNNAEHEIWKFLALLSENKMDIMRKQYPESEEETTQTKDECADRRQLEKDDYYCNEDLVKQLVFDAKLSDPYFKDWIATDGKKALAEKYNVSVRFIATSSGLTRWHYIRANDSDKNEIYDNFGNRTKGYDGKVFGDEYHNAIEETWYKAAVLQHIINKESIVISTQLPILDETIKNKPPVLKDNDTILTSSYAIFYKDGDSETPASVVGFQFMYSSFNKSFMDITRSRTIDNEGLSCDSEEYDCYIIDSSGYIVFSVDVNNIGTFFGEKHPHVLKSFINESIFDHVEVFNYQALCPVDMIPEKNCGWLFKSPFSIVGAFFRWLLTETIILMSDVYSWNFNNFAYSHVIVDDDDYSDVINIEYNATTPAPEVENNTDTAKNKEKEDYFSCDHRISLYILNQSYFKDKISPVIQKDEEGDCYPAYWASYVPKTNLLLVVVKKDWVPHPSCEAPPTTKPVPTTASTSGREPCHKLDLGSLTRRRLEGCYTYHEEEVNITTCSKGISISASAQLLTVSALVAFASTMLF